VIKILFIGDIIGKPGRVAVKEILPELKIENNISLTIANGENLAGGIGITPNVAQEIKSYGVDVITTGNHVWRRKEIEPFLSIAGYLLRPANYPPGNPGRGYLELTINNLSVAIINLCGRVFMGPLGNLDCPFRTADQLINGLKNETNVIIVDMHAEATSEKMAMGWYLDGRVSAVIGTHTHVQTSDERILPKKTAYITDVGMVGSIDSIIGVNKDKIIKMFLMQRPTSFTVAKKNIVLNSLIIEINEKTGEAYSIKRVNIPYIKGGSN